MKRERGDRDDDVRLSGLDHPGRAEIVRDLPGALGEAPDVTFVRFRIRALHGEPVLRLALPESPTGGASEVARTKKTDVRNQGKRKR